MILEFSYVKIPHNFYIFEIENKVNELFLIKTMII